ncbi:MAG TPA: hypothetical protein VKU39_10880 [Streptosporangiaceae bacterium]|nr:hypothetical protein [Streptosporangiaceae bacterium]
MRRYQSLPGQGLIRPSAAIVRVCGNRADAHEATDVRADELADVGKQIGNIPAAARNGSGGRGCGR